MSDQQFDKVGTVADAADAFVDDLVARGRFDAPADNALQWGYLWHGWALRDAFYAGARWAESAPSAERARVDPTDTRNIFERDAATASVRPSMDGWKLYCEVFRELFTSPSVRPDDIVSPAVLQEMVNRLAPSATQAPVGDLLDEMLLDARDAKRYRWLREHVRDGNSFVPVTLPIEFDRAIDAKMASSAQGAK